MNNPLKKQIFDSKIVVFNVLDYFSASLFLGLGRVLTVFMALGSLTLS